MSKDLFIPEKLKKRPYLKIKTSDNTLFQTVLPTVPHPTAKNNYTKGNSPESEMGRRLAKHLYKKLSTSPFKSIVHAKMDYYNWNVIKLRIPNFSKMRNVWKPLLIQTNRTDSFIYNERSNKNIKLHHLKSNDQFENETLLTKMNSFNNKYSTPIHKLSYRGFGKCKEREISSENQPSNSIRSTTEMQKSIKNKKFISSVMKDAQNIDSYLKSQ